MENYDGARVKLKNKQLNKLKSQAKSKTGTILRITKKSFQNGELPHELFLARRQKLKKEMPSLTTCPRIKYLVKLSCLKLFNQEGFLLKRYVM